jgi:transcriptional regulator with XRE-family HTH domain
MAPEMIQNYLQTLQNRSKMTLQEISEKSGIAITTVKNLYSGLTTNPGINTLGPVIQVQGGSLDELYGLHRPDDRSPSDYLTAAYEERIARIKEEHRDYVELMTREHTAQLHDLTDSYQAQVKEANARADAASAAADKKVSFVILATIGLMVALEVLDILATLLK